MFERIKHMLIKEFIQVFRDPRMLIVIFLIPCIQVLVIGYAVTFDVKHVRTAIYDLDNSERSREVTARFARSGYFDIVANVGDERGVRDVLDRGDALVLVRFDHGFAEKLRNGRTAELQILVDGSDSNTAAIAMNYAVKIATAYSNQVVAQRMDRTMGPAGKSGGAELRYRAWFNENLESCNFFVPGVLVMVVAMTTQLLTSMAIVREREIGTMEQIVVTPITPTEFILGKTVPFAVIGFVDVVLVTLVGVFWFEVPIHGHFPLLLVCTALFLTNTLGVGLLISTFSQTQQQAMMATFGWFFPAMLLSGFATPIANMPPLVQWLTFINPIRYFLVIVRSIFLKGVGVDVLWPQMLPLLVMGIAVLWLSARQFQKTL